MVDELSGWGAIGKNPIRPSPVNFGNDPHLASMSAERANDLVFSDSHLAPIGFHDVD